MARRIIWTSPAEKDLQGILTYWVDRNGSSTFSRKLYGRIKTAIQRTIQYPFIGRPTDIIGIRVLRIDDYLIFYEVTADAIVVHHAWDGRRDLSKLEF
ncbi:MAG: type II toxin-antitoxin system RelE/ParE family toxin [Bacteroidota bacterium]|nr:type II toxin-antitoxin system RelE/ParE family toxin [Bacteroidota bacterium]